MNKLELLAPAGDIESFNAAIESGADAVYLGLGNFNAGAKAQNFNEENIREFIFRAHFLGVKVYITLNTLLHNNEFSDMFRMVKVAFMSKSDAFLVQDLGVCYALKRAFPDIVLHASTQMGIHNLYGAKQAERLGISRVVLSRETKLSDIIAISENTNLELEYFVQGALCAAFSGNCYLSESEFGCSGNRGVCKQPCRMRYFAENGKVSDEGYMLSARDFCLIDNLEELIDAGVTSFKIEGRLRRAGYVAVATQSYRKVLDNLNKTNPNREDEKLRLMKVFNRGEYLYRSYLDEGVPDSVINKKSQNHQGIEIGKVLEVKPFKDIYAITISSSHPIAVGDGLKLFENGEEVASLGVGSLKNAGRNVYTIFSKAKTKIGQTVNLILDSVAEAKALSVKKFVAIELEVVANAGEKLQICARSGDVKVSITSDFECEKAINKSTDESEIKQQITKTAESGFEVVSVEVETNGVFLPKSVLNGLRREALALLKDEIIKENEKNLSSQICDEEIEKIVDVAMSREVNVANVKEIELEEVQESAGKETKESEVTIRGKVEKQEFTNLTYIYSDSFSNTDDFSNTKDENIFAISPNDFSANEIMKLYKTVKSIHPDSFVALDLPIIANGADLELLQNSLADLKEKAIKFDFVVSNNLYGLQFANYGYKIIAGFGHNVYNNLTTLKLKELGVCMVVQSVELEKNLTSVLPVLTMRNFRLPLMTFAHCPYKTVNGNTCKKCSYSNNLTYSKGGKQYFLRRVKLYRNATLQ